MTAIGELNKYKVQWKTRYDVNSTVQSLTKELKKLKKKRDKGDNSLTEQILKLDFLLYMINDQYYDIVKELK